MQFDDSREEVVDCFSGTSPQASMASLDENNARWLPVTSGLFIASRGIATCLLGLGGYPLIKVSVEKAVGATATVK